MAENTATQRDVADVAADLSGSRWWWVAYGAFSVAAGLAAIVWPDVTVEVLAFLFGVQLLVLGILRIVSALAAPSTVGATVLGVLVGFLAFLVALACLRAPDRTVVVLTLLIGAFWLVHGVADVVQGVLGRGGSGRALTIVGGLVGVVGGIVVLSSPGATAVALAWILGVFLVVQGAVTIVAALVVGRGPTGTALPRTEPATPRRPVTGPAAG